MSAKEPQEKQKEKGITKADVVRLIKQFRAEEAPQKISPQGERE